MLILTRRVGESLMVGDEITISSFANGNRQKVVVEWSGAATTAALLSGRVKAEGGRVAAVISGGNLETPSTCSDCPAAPQVIA